MKTTTLSVSKRGAKAGSIALACLALVFLAALAATTLSGCKYTDVLTEHIEDPTAEVDDNIDPLYRNNPDAPEDPNRETNTLSDSDDMDTEIAKLPHYDPDAPDNGPTKRKRHNDETPHDDEASQGDEQSGSTSTSTGKGSDKGDEEGTGDELQSDETDLTSDQETEGGTGGDTIVVGAEGAQGDPGTGTIAATGTYATIAQMLGGAGGLKAADESWLANMPADVFPGELASVQVGWSGDGTAAGSTLVDELCNTIKPQIVLYDGSTPNLSSSDIQRLKDAGIKVTDGTDASLPKLPKLNEYHTTDSDVVQAVNLVAGILSGVQGVGDNALNRRNQWLSFHHDVLKACYDMAKGGKSGYSYRYRDLSNPHLYQSPVDQTLLDLNASTQNRITTVYVDEWWNPGVSRITVNQNRTVNGEPLKLNHDGQSVDCSDGIALSVGSSSRTYMVLDFYLQFAGVVNNAYDGNMPDVLGRRSVIIPGSTTDLPSAGSYAERSIGNDSALWYAADDENSPSSWVSLGKSTFPVMLVNGEASEDIAAHVKASAAKSDGLYRMEGSYQVVTVPSGLAGRWSCGNPESFLVAPWACRISTTDSAAALNTASDLVRQYYEFFYRCSNWSGTVKNWDTSVTAG